MKRPLTNLLETGGSEPVGMYFHGTSEENYRSIIEEGGLRPVGRNDCDIEPGLDAVKEDILRIERGYPTDEKELNIHEYLSSNYERFIDNASEESVEFMEGMEGMSRIQETMEQFGDSIFTMEFISSTDGAHRDDCVSVARDFQTARNRKAVDVVLELELPTNSVFESNSGRVPGIIPSEYISTVYGSEPSISRLRDQYGSEHSIDYREI